MTQKLYLAIFFFVILFISCENEQLKFDAPSVNLLETKKFNNNTGYIKYQIKKGYGAKIKELYAEFYDLTDTTAQVVKKNLQIKDSVQFTDSALLNNLQNQHDYRVLVKLISEKNEYKSTSRVLSLSSNYDESFLGILGCDLYISEYEEMYLEEYNGFLVKPLQKGQYFSVNIYFSDTFLSKNKYEFKLNESISLTPDATYGSYSDYVYWGMKIPDNIPAGVYTLDLYVNGNKFTAYSKIRVLSGTYSETNIPVMPIVFYQSNYKTDFILHNKIYYIYDKKIAYWDLSTNQWFVRNDLDNDLVKPYQYCSVLDANFSYNETQYVFILYGSDYSNLKLQLLKYNETMDQWQLISEFPGTSDMSIFVFRAGDCVYLGYSRPENRVFWEYNLKTNNWKKKNDLPKEMNGTITGTCTNENTGLCMTSYRELWQYDSTVDIWQKLSSLYGGPYTRYSTRVVYDKGFVYVLGGYTYTAYGYEDLSDIWRYNLSTKNWEYIYLCQYTYNESASKFINNDKILMIPCVGYNTNCKAEVAF